MKPKVLILLLLVSLTLAGPAWGEFSLFSKERLQPKYTDIRFWDDYAQDYRGLRVLFYTVPQEKQNREVDKRLHETMGYFLSTMTEKVITLESFTDRNQQRMVENVIADRVDEWKVENKLNPEVFFQQLPFMDIDAIVFMERTDYDQGWNRDLKKLKIGLYLAAFEMDFGEPLFANRFYDELPWQGEKTNYRKVEQQALLKAADALGATLSETAKLINSKHLEEVRIQNAADAALEKARVKQLRAANEGLAKLVKQAEATLKTIKEPTATSQQIAKDAEALKKLLKINPGQLTPEQEEERVKLAYSIEVNLDQLGLAQPSAPSLESNGSRSITQDQNPFYSAPISDPTPMLVAPHASEEVEAQPIPTEPSQPQEFQSVPKVSVPAGNLFDRRWLLNGKSGSSPVPAGTSLGSSSRMSRPLPSGSVRYATPGVPEH